MNWQRLDIENNRPFDHELVCCVWTERTDDEVWDHFDKFAILEYDEEDETFYHQNGCEVEELPEFWLRI